MSAASDDRRALENHRAWLGFVQPVGLVVSPTALIQLGAVLPERVVDEQQELLRQAPLLADDDDRSLVDFLSFAQKVLGWQLEDVAGAPGGPELAVDLSVKLEEYGETLTPSFAVLDFDKRPILLIQEVARGRDLDASGDGPGWQASHQARFERLLREKELPAGLIVNGKSLRLVYAPRGETSGHVTFPVAAMCEVMGRPLLGALILLLGRSRLWDVPQGARLLDLLTESRKQQGLVSVELSAQVLDALWELLRGFQQADRYAVERGQASILSELSRDRPQDIYGGLLTIVLRLVFLLYAEHQGAMPGDATFVRNYSVGGLFERLRADAGRNPDTMDRRFGAYAQLISLFRLVFQGGGHGPLEIPARHGELFDPARYPFLEGGAHDALERFDAPRVPDGCIHRVLEKLLVLGGERLSYRALDVEQIGSVYESMMGFSIERAKGVSIGVGSATVVVDLEALLRKPGADRARTFLAETDLKLSTKEASAFKAATTVDDLVVALGGEKGRRGKLSHRTPTPLAAGSLFLQPGEERRKSGSHYTPRELTEPIVHATLRPVLAQLGKSPKPDQLLALKVLDPAMGSGAFLVEACRQLAEKLVVAWDTHGGMPPLPPDETRLLLARRLVAQRCLYGVDRNPFAVSLAKLSLWLVTLAKEHAFTFLDHALKHGDSLVGLSRAAIDQFDWDLAEEPGPLFDGKSALAKVTRLREQITKAPDDAQDAQRLAFKDSEDAAFEARLRGDLCVRAFFEGDSAKSRRTKLALASEAYKRWVDDGRLDHTLRSALDELRQASPPLAPFHWEIEFPEVFQGTKAGAAGFDIIVGNPPFAGKNTIAAGNPPAYGDWLKQLHEDSHGNADLVAHFFRRAYFLLREGGCFGLIATNTISQGDTRGTGLRAICRAGGVIYEAHKRYKWPGLAAVVVSVVHVQRRAKGAASDGVALLDGRQVPRISAFLFHEGGDEDPSVLLANAGKSFQGVIVLGMGFTFDQSINDDDDDANSIGKMNELVRSNPRNRERIFPYIGGDELNKSPTHAHHRFVINFGDLDEAQIREQWPDLLAVVESKVRGKRGAHSTAPWWQFERSRPELFQSLYAPAHREVQERQRVLAVNCGATPHMAMSFLPASIVPANTLVVFPLASYAAFTALQSRIHELWARFFGSSLEDRLRYTPTDCFETFPFPKDWETHPKLEQAGARYYEHRARLMVRHNEGLTDTYNRFHDRDHDGSGVSGVPPHEVAEAIVELRRLHAEMDRAVLDAYGWSDVATTCVFELEHDQDADDDSGRERRKPWRLRWPEAVRDAVLARLLKLNAERAEQERLGGESAEAKPGKKGKKGTKKGGGAGPQGALF
ncbi:MAG: N-6 DNA methylase [Deltaproteobacteria bacterium]|nr:N-6 DNA methylase [Deltaproteobacteria bacterium]